MHLFWAFRPIWLAFSISGSSFWLVDTYFWSYFSWLAKSGCQNLKLAGNTFPPFPSFLSPGNQYYFFKFFHQLLVVTKPHIIYLSINLIPWTNQFIQYGLYVLEKFVLCHGFEKILQTFNSILVLLHVCHHVYTLAKKFSAEGRDFFLVNLVHLHVLQYFFDVAQMFLAIGTRDVFPVLLRLLFSSTSHSSTCSISSVLLMYIFWQIAHL